MGDELKFEKMLGTGEEKSTQHQAPPKELVKFLAKTKLQKLEDKNSAGTN